MTPTFDQIPSLLAELIQRIDRIEAAVTAPKVGTGEGQTYLTVDEAAAYTNLAKATIYGLTRRHLIPYLKKGKKLYFVEKELSDWIKNSK
jgi:excisionase family DNA binding protein